MTKPTYSLTTPIFMTLIVLALGAGNWYFKPEALIFWLIAMSFLPIMLVTTEFLHRKECPGRAGELTTTRYSIVGAGMLICIALGVPLLEHTGMSDNLSPYITERMTGVIMGIFMMLYGNFMPKRPVPLDTTSIAPKDAQNMNHFTGIVFMLTGLATIVVWFIAPIEWNSEISTGVMFFGMSFVMGKALTIHGRSKRKTNS
jgi:hypothetical protein